MLCIQLIHTIWIFLNSNFPGKLEGHTEGNGYVSRVVETVTSYSKFRHSPDS